MYCGELLGTLMTQNPERVQELVNDMIDNHHLICDECCQEHINALSTLDLSHLLCYNNPTNKQGDSE